MEEARGGETFVDIDDESPKELGEQEAASGGGEDVVHIENANDDGEREKRTLSFGNTYKIPIRSPTVCFKSQPFSHHLLGEKSDVDGNFYRI